MEVTVIEGRVRGEECLYFRCVEWDQIVMGKGQAEEVGHDNLYDYILVVKFCQKFYNQARPYIAHELIKMKHI